MAYLINKLKNTEYRLTKPRKIIYEILENSNGHLSAEEIYKEAYSIYPAIGLTTVYRTLDLFMKMGIVNRYDFGDGRARYELNYIEDSSREHHHHLVCKSCHRIIDYSDFVDEEVELIKKTICNLEKKYNFSITDHFIEFYGYCNECLKKLKREGHLINEGVKNESNSYIRREKY